MITLQGIEPKMIANNLTPSEPVHPGEVIKDEIEYRGISQRKFAEMIHVSLSLINEMLNGKRPVTTEYALIFEASLGISHESLLKMQQDYDVQVAMRNATFINRLAEIRKVAALW